MSKLRGILIADLHIGAIDTEDFKNQIREYILKPLYEIGNIDFLIFLGDFWDKKISLSDKSSELGMWFMNKVTSIVKTIRVIYGTESHEVDQYNVFSIYEENPELDFKIIHSVSDEYLFDKLHILYLPEEYITSKDEYYREYFSKDKEYDYIFGHGVVAEAMTMVKHNKESKKENRLKPPVFTTADFKKCCKGEVYFGHYHVRSIIQDWVYYVGSFTRWIHGEEEEKGFYEIIYDDSFKKPYTNIFHENFGAKVYKTYCFPYDHEFFRIDTPVSDWVKTIKNLIDMNENANIRFIFNIPDTYENPEFFMTSIRELLRNFSNISYDFVNGYVEKKRKRTETSINAISEKYSYIFNKNLSVGAVVSTFIKDKNGKEIESETMDTYLNTDVMKLIEEELSHFD